jgi:peptidyl-dipeptidase Dcp
MAETHPLLADWTGPLGLPDFASVDPAQFVTAFEIALEENLAEIDALAHQPEAPTFENTVLALDRAGARLSRLSRLFGNLCAAETGPELQEAERVLAPRLAAHDSAISLNEALFARLDAVHKSRAALGLSPVQERLLDRFMLDFERGGARLTGAARERAAQLAEELATLHTRFSQNLLADESSWHMELETEDDLAGLPEWLRAAARSAAAELGLPAGTHSITLSRSLVSPFLTWSSRRDLRERAWNAWVRRGEKGDEHDNRSLIVRILELRLELARLHGFQTFADFQLDDTMAKRVGNVEALLHQVWKPARAAALAEYEELNGIARQSGEAEVNAWDWRYYAEVVRRTRYNLSDDEVKPYFSLDSVLAAALDCANRLFGISFVERPDIVTYHADVRVFEVFGRSGERCGVFLSDNFARPTKRSGAWMSSYRLRTPDAVGDEQLPIVANHNNFAKAEAGGATLLSLDDARTLFHEFGHGLHGLLSDVPFERLAGTAVLRDFVELPSQLYEHWLLEPEVLRRHARHVETGEQIPEDLIERIVNSARFNQGFETVEYTVCALVDLMLHQHTDPGSLDLGAFERETLAGLGMPAAMVMRHRLTQFAHLFSSSGYASNYYVYMWAEVLDADAYDAFIEAGDPFDSNVAERLYTYVYSSGNSIDPEEAYRAFRGRDAGIEPLLRGRGLLGVPS